MINRHDSRPSCTGFDSQLSQFFSEEKLLMLLRFINGAVYKKVDSDLKMLIEPLLGWLAAS